MFASLNMSYTWMRSASEIETRILISSDAPPAATLARSVWIVSRICCTRATRSAWVWAALSPNRFARSSIGMRGVAVTGPPAEENVGGLKGGM